jgi:uncharacterized protein YndB with AHSA1/START domain
MSANQASADRIEQQLRLGAPRSRVWRAHTDPKEFSRQVGG